MEDSFFFNSLNGDRKYLTERFADYFGTFLSNGLFLHNAEALKVRPYNGRTVRISSGKGFMQGYAYVNTSNVDKTLDVAVANRIDRIVLQLNMPARKINLVVKKGTEATEPIAPELIRTADIWELGLADISLNSGTTQITDKMITDLRNNGNYCGGVTITVDRIDITEDISNAITTFTEAATRTNILTTEKASTIFGKIRKWFSDLKKLAFKDTITTADIDNRAITKEKLGDLITIGTGTENGVTVTLSQKASEGFSISLSGTPINAKIAQYASSDEEKGTIESRLTKLGFRQGSIVLSNTQANIGGATLKRQGNYVLVNINIPNMMYSSNVYGGVIGTLPEYFRPRQQQTYNIGGLGNILYEKIVTQVNCSLTMTISTNGDISITVPRYNWGLTPQDYTCNLKRLIFTAGFEALPII